MHILIVELCIVELMSTDDEITKSMMKKVR